MSWVRGEWLRRNRRFRVHFREEEVLRKGLVDRDRVSGRKLVSLETS